MHGFNDKNGKRWTACCECNRGGNGNDNNGCSSGFKITKWDRMGCFSGVEIVGEKSKKINRGKERYKRYLEYGDMFESFLHFCYWDQANEKS